LPESIAGQRSPSRTASQKQRHAVGHLPGVARKWARTHAPSAAVPLLRASIPFGGSFAEFGQFGVQTMPQGTLGAQLLQQLFSASEGLLRTPISAEQRSPSSGHFLFCEHATPRNLAEKNAMDPQRASGGQQRRPVASSGKQGIRYSPFSILAAASVTPSPGT